MGSLKSFNRRWVSVATLTCVRMWPDYSGHSLKSSKSLHDPLTVREVSARGRALSACQSLPPWINVISTGIYKAHAPPVAVPSVLRVFNFRRVNFFLCVYI